MTRILLIIGLLVLLFFFLPSRIQDDMKGFVTQYYHRREVNYVLDLQNRGVITIINLDKL